MDPWLAWMMAVGGGVSLAFAFWLLGESRALLDDVQKLLEMDERSDG